MERLLGLYTPGKLAAARRALSGDARPAPDERPRTRCQMHALPETLTLVCETPFASVDDLSHLKRVPASTLRGLGLAEVHPHRLAMLSDRPLWRHVPTPAGIAALGGDDLLYSHPVSRHWLPLPPPPPPRRRARPRAAPPLCTAPPSPATGCGCSPSASTAWRSSTRWRR